MGAHMFTPDFIMYGLENKVRFGSILTFPSFDDVWVGCKQEKEAYKVLESVILMERLVI